MPDLSFEVTGVEVPAFAALPTLLFGLRITNADAQEHIHSVALRCQIRILPSRRRYDPREQARLGELFGAPERWGETARNFLWTHATTTAPRFTGTTLVELPVVCTYDFDVVAAKYFDALEDGEIPLTFLFSGTVFYAEPSGALQVSQISWENEAAFDLPVARWREMMARYFPNSAWIRLRKDVFDRLYQYRVAHGMLTWEDALVRLLAANAEEARP